MKYVIDTTNKKLSYYKVTINGLNVNPKNEVKDQSIKPKTVTIVDTQFQENYIKKRINRKIDKLINFMLRILNDEDDTSEEDSGMVLDEINRLKGIVINKYRKYLKDNEYKSLLAKLILIEEEFKRNYNDKLYINYHNNDYYEEEIMSSMGR